MKNPSYRVKGKKQRGRGHSMEDNKIVELYFSRSEEAIRETAIKYGRLCSSVAYEILGNREDAEEIANDTYLRAWNSIPPTRPDSLKAYLAKIAGNLARDRLSKKNAVKRSGEVLMIQTELSECMRSTESNIASEIDLKRILNSFLESLPRKSRIIFVQRYWYARAIRDIGKELGINENTVTVKLKRMRNRLKKILEEEGYDV